MLLVATPAYAQHMANVFFPEIRSVRSATGLVYAQQQTMEVPAQWSYDAERNGVVLKIQLPANLPPHETLVSGVIVDENSQLNFGPLSVADLGNPLSFVASCSATPAPQISGTQAGLFSQLVEIRQRRVQVARKKLRETVSPELFKRLRELEKGFNIERDKPLSLDLSPGELSERLDVLFHTVKRYEFYKSRKHVEAALDSRLKAQTQ